MMKRGVEIIFYQTVRIGRPFSFFNKKSKSEIYQYANEYKGFELLEIYKDL